MAASDEEMDDFYNMLQEAIDNTQNRDITIVMRGFNAKIGKLNYNSDICGTYGLGDQNERGANLLELCSVNNLAVANTLVQHHPRHLYTWVSPDRKIHNQIDYFMINKKWTGSLQNAKTRPGSDCNSDHQLLVIDLKFRLKKLQKPPAVLRFDYMTISDDYRVEISNRFESLLQCDDDKTPNELWEEGKNIILSAAKGHIPRRRKKNYQWISNQTINEVEKRKQLKAKGLNNNVKVTEYNKQNALVQRMMRKDKEKHINEQCKRIEDKSITNSIKDLYQGVKTLTNKFKPTIDTIKDENGNILGEAEEVKERWAQYSTDLYKKNPNIVISQHTFVVNDKEELPPLYSEVAKAINELKANKSPGFDDITAELVKCGDNNVVSYFLKLCTSIWLKKTWPDDWIKSVFVPIPKKGDTLQCCNNRTIALISHCSKILLKIIACRMQTKLKGEISEEQAGFRSGMGTRDQILNLKIVIEKNREYGRNIYLCSIDYRKAFDMVSHELLWKGMLEMGFSSHIVDLIKGLYTDQSATVRTTHRLTVDLRIEKGARQGCIVSPHLFNIYSEVIMRTALEGFEGTVKIGGRSITNLRYADDIVLVGGSIEELQNIVNRVHEASSQAGLYLNTSKTKVMKIIRVPLQNEQSNISVNGQDIENVKDFVYLGAMITENYDDSKGIKRRITIAKNAMISLVKIFGKTDQFQLLQRKDLPSLVFGIATYGSECWILKTTDKKKINSFELWCYRLLLRINWTDTKSNQYVLGKIGTSERLLTAIVKRKMAFVGHIFRKGDICKDLLTGTVYGKRGRGRPKTRYSDNIREFGGNWSFVDLYRLAQNRQAWRATAVQLNELPVQ